MRGWRARGGLGLLLVLVLALGVAACGGGSGERGADDADAGGGGATEVAVDPAECGLDAFGDAEKPVAVTFWHAMAEENETVLRDLTERFHAAQDDVRVELVRFPTYDDVFEKLVAGLTTGDLPDLAHLQETHVQAQLDNESAVSVQACVDADDYDLSDHLQQAIAYYSTSDTLHAMPFNVSNPILLYDRSDFVKAGLDPNDPPRTLDEVREYAQQIVDAGAAEHGMALQVRSYLIEFLLAKSGADFVDQGNGREARATEAVFDTPEALEIWTWWRDMVRDGLAVDTGATPGAIDHLLAIGNGDASMVMEGSGSLGPIRAVLESGQFPGVEVSAGVLPALQEGGGVPVGDGALWLMRRSEPAVRAAAWQYVKYLLEPAQTAELAARAGYVPLRTSATDDPALKAVWEAEPAFSVAYRQLTEGPADAAALGSVIGDYDGVRRAVEAGILSMLANDVEPATALAEAEAAATQAIQDYNRRLGR